MLRRCITSHWQLTGMFSFPGHLLSRSVCTAPLKPLSNVFPHTRSVSPETDHQLIPCRTIIMNTKLKFVDNTDNAKKRNRLDRPYCIKLHKNSKVGKFGDVIKIAHRGKVHNALVVSNRRPSKWLPRYDHNHIILLDEKLEPVGTRIHGPVPSALRRKQGINSKIIAMASRFI